ncbi:ExbD/TolR family protein [Saccharicrinis sp. FJH54]|uniref:ExbD/TolR family protein n=1 Tax=Saccharicrinis sp. FJH54 TaxID=3344665 RepID=UPI0035D3FEE5
MATFKKKKGGDQQAINTASLPDIVFMLLFFFMVSTTMREVTYKVQIKLPNATELDKLEKKSLVSFIYIGSPLPQYRGLYGSGSRIQLNDKFSSPDEIMGYIATEREKMSEVDRPKMTVSLKVDKDTKMQIVQDTKYALRKAQALKINYSARNPQKTQ